MKTGTGRKKGVGSGFRRPVGTDPLPIRMDEGMRKLFCLLRAVNLLDR